MRRYDDYFRCFTLNFDEGIVVLKANDPSYFKIIDKIFVDPKFRNLTFNDLESNMQFLIGLQNFESGKNY